MTIRSLALLIFVCAFLQLNAQDYRIKPGEVQLSTSVGLISTYAADATSTVVPPVSLSAEVFLSPNLSLGLTGSYSQYEGEFVNINAGIAEYYQTTTLVVALRSAVHSNDLNGWRVYGGLSVGANLPEIEKEVELLAGEQIRDDELPSFSRPQESSLLFSGFVGTRKTLNAHLSIYGELGFGISLANIGASYKF